MLRVMDLRRSSRSSLDVGAGDRESGSPVGRGIDLRIAQIGSQWRRLLVGTARVGMALVGCCSRVPVVAPSSASLQLGAVAESPLSPPCQHHHSRALG
jgi:hypothetical protein